MKNYFTKNGLVLVKRKRDIIGKPILNSKFSTSSFLVMDKKDSIQGGMTLPCSALLKDLSLSLNSKALVVFNDKAYLSNFLSKGLNDVYYKWLLNKSPWANAFLTKDVRVARVYGIEMNLEAPWELVYSATIAARQPWEFPSYARTASVLMRKGVNPEFAFLCSMYFPSNSDKDFVINIYPLGDGHTPIDPPKLFYSKEGVIRFLLKEPNPERLSIAFNETKFHKSCSKIWYNNIHSEDFNLFDKVITAAECSEIDKRENRKDLFIFFRAKEPPKYSLQKLSNRLKKVWDEEFLPMLEEGIQ